MPVFIGPLPTLSGVTCQQTVTHATMIPEYISCGPAGNVGQLIASVPRLAHSSLLKTKTNLAGRYLFAHLL